jgi:hypothetical protein
MVLRGFSYSVDNMGIIWEESRGNPGRIRGESRENQGRIRGESGENLGRIWETPGRLPRESGETQRLQGDSRETLEVKRTDAWQQYVYLEMI